MVREEREIGTEFPVSTFPFDMNRRPCGVCLRETLVLCR